MVMDDYKTCMLYRAVTVVMIIRERKKCEHVGNKDSHVDGVSRCDEVSLKERNKHDPNPNSNPCANPKP